MLDSFLMLEKSSLGDQLEYLWNYADLKIFSILVVYKNIVLIWLLIIHCMSENHFCLQLAQN